MRSWLRDRRERREARRRQAWLNDVLARASARADHQDAARMAQLRARWPYPTHPSQTYWS